MTYSICDPLGALRRRLRLNGRTDVDTTIDAFVRSSPQEGQMLTPGVTADPHMGHLWGGCEEDRRYGI